MRVAYGSLLIIDNKVLFFCNVYFITVKDYKADEAGVQLLFFTPGVGGMPSCVCPHRLILLLLTGRSWCPCVLLLVQYMAKNDLAPDIPRNSGANNRYGDDSVRHVH